MTEELKKEMAILTNGAITMEVPSAQKDTYLRNGWKESVAEEQKPATPKGKK